MSRQFRYRITAMVLGGLIFGAPLLTNGSASAEEKVEEGGRQVVFEGGEFFDFSCESRPNIEKMVVPAESRVRVVNRTGHDAQLWLAGEAMGVLPDEESTDVVFRRGTTEVVMEPDCALGNDVAPALITATPSATAKPDPTPAPAGGPSPSATAPSAAGSPSASGSGSSAVTRPSRTGPAKGTGGKQPYGGAVQTSASAVTQAATAAAQSMPQGGSAPRIKVRNRPRTAGSSVPAFAGMPPGDKKAILAGVPSLDLAPATQDAVPAAAPSTPAEVAAAEPVAAMRQVPEGPPLGLLGLVAAVCVMGVGAAAIRAIVSQRANRAKVA